MLEASPRPGPLPIFRTRLKAWGASVGIAIKTIVLIHPICVSQRPRSPIEALQATVDSEQQRDALSGPTPPPPPPPPQLEVLNMKLKIEQELQYVIAMQAHLLSRACTHHQFLSPGPPLPAGGHSRGRPRADAKHCRHDGEHARNRGAWMCRVRCSRTSPTMPP